MPIVKAPTNVTELRDAVLEEFARVRDGVISPEQGKATANLAGKVLAATALEMEYRRLGGKPMSIPFLDQPGDVKALPEGLKALTE